MVITILTVFKKMVDSKSFRDDLTACGFDICQKFHPAWYNDLITKEGIDLTPLPEGEVAFLIGNTKAMWPKFISWLRRQAGIPEDPIDFYSKTNIVRIIENIVSAHTHTVRKK